MTKIHCQRADSFTNGKFGWRVRNHILDFHESFWLLISPQKSLGRVAIISYQAPITAVIKAIGAIQASLWSPTQLNGAELSSEVTETMSNWRYDMNIHNIEDDGVGQLVLSC